MADFPEIQSPPPYQGPGALGVLGAVVGGISEGLDKNTERQNKQADIRRKLFNEMHDMLNKATLSGQVVPEAVIKHYYQSMTGQLPDPQTLQQMVDQQKSAAEEVQDLAKAQAVKARAYAAAAPVKAGAAASDAETKAKQLALNQEWNKARVGHMNAATKAIQTRVARTPEQKSAENALDNLMRQYRSLTVKASDIKNVDPEQTKTELDAKNSEIADHVLSNPFLAVKLSGPLKDRYTEMGGKVGAAAVGPTVSEWEKGVKGLVARGVSRKDAEAKATQAGLKK